VNGVDAQMREVLHVGDRVDGDESMMNE